VLGRLDEPDGCGTGAGGPESRKVVDVELDGELPPIAPAPPGARYRWARALVRLHGRPLGVVELPLKDPSPGSSTGSSRGPGALPLLDIVMLLLASRMHATRRELGRVVCDWLAGARWTSLEHRLMVAAVRGLPGPPVDERALVLLVWLHHVAGTISRAPGYAGHGLWRRGNVDPIARAVVRAR
jgi:hypothetical protein